MIALLSMIALASVPFQNYYPERSEGPVVLVNEKESRSFALLRMTVLMEREMVQPRSRVFISAI
jgi:hypothetical protein